MIKFLRKLRRALLPTQKEQVDDLMTSIKKASISHSHLYIKDVQSATRYNGGGLVLMKAGCGSLKNKKFGTSPDVRKD
jgi:hypothetical protein